jgi:predicted RNA-binding protein associated with RNAse of E/G family
MAAFNRRFTLQIATLIVKSEFDEALRTVDQAEQALHDQDVDRWLAWSCMASAG